MLQLMHEGCSYTHPPLSIDRCPFIQLSELEQCRVKKLAQGFNTAAQDSNPGSRSRGSKALPLSHCGLQSLHKLSSLVVTASPVVTQLLLNVAVNGLSIQSSSSATVLPSPTSVINLADSHDKAAFLMVTKMKEEPMDVESLDVNKEEVRS